MRLGWQELLIILIIVALVFGVGRLAGLGRVLGRSIREFKEELHGGSSSEGEKGDSVDPQGKEG